MLLRAGKGIVRERDYYTLRCVMQLVYKVIDRTMEAAKHITLRRQGKIVCLQLNEMPLKHQLNTTLNGTEFQKSNVISEAITSRLPKKRDRKFSLMNLNRFISLKTENELTKRFDYQSSQ